MEWQTNENIKIFNGNHQKAYFKAYKTTAELT